MWSSVVDGGASFATLATAAPNTGSFVWTVTGPISPAALVSVSWNGGPAAGTSGLFAIAAPAIAVAAPGAGVPISNATSGSYTWLVTGPRADGAKIRVTWTGTPSAAGKSVNFKIR